MSLKKKNRTLLIKLFYKNGGNLSTALRECRRLNCLRKDLTSRQTLKKIIQKFEKTGDLGVMRGRERKRISNETVEEVAFADFERESGSHYSASSARSVSHDLSLRWSTSAKDSEVHSKSVFIKDQL